MARRIAPGSRREFAFIQWPRFDGALWQRMLEAARERELPRAPAPIVASDRDAGAITAATANAERAGVAADIEFSRRALSAITPPAGAGVDRDQSPLRRARRRQEGAARPLRAVRQRRAARRAPAGRWRCSRRAPSSSARPGCRSPSRSRRATAACPCGSLRLRCRPRRRVHQHDRQHRAHEADHDRSPEGRPEARDVEAESERARERAREHEHQRVHARAGRGRA